MVHDTDVGHDTLFENGNFQEARNGGATLRWADRQMIAFAVNFQDRRDDLKAASVKTSPVILKMAVLALQQFSGRDLDCYPRVQTIADTMNVSKRTAVQAISDLVRLRVVAYLDRDQGSARRRYAIHYRRLVASFAADLPAKLKAAILDADDGSVTTESVPEPARLPRGPAQMAHGTRAAPALDPRGNCAGSDLKEGKTTDINTVEMNSKHAGQDRFASGGRSVGSNAASRTADDVRRILTGSEWRLRATEALRRIGFSDDRQIRDVLDDVGSEERFVEILKLIDRRRRKVEAGTAKRVKSWPGYFRWLASRPDVTLDQ